MSGFPIDCRGDLFAPIFAGLEWQGDILTPTGCKALSAFPGIQYAKGTRYHCVRYTIAEGSHRFCVAVLCWDGLTGAIESVHVLPDYRRQGIARQLLALARHAGFTVRHSDDLTPDGQAWAQSVG